MNSLNFRDLLLSIPSQAESGLKASQNIKLAKKPDQIVICGMGGSALAGEFLQAVFNEFKIKIPVYSHKDYDLPLTITKNSFMVCISYSGNTEETISAYKKALSQKLKILAMASGGKLKDLAIKNKTPFISIDLNNLPPRLSAFYMFSALVGVVVNSKILPMNVIRQLKDGVRNLRIKTIEDSANDIAAKIGGKTPLIYSSLKMDSLAYFLKISFNENAKIHAFSNFLPECQHNEIQGFADESLNLRFYSIFLKDSADSQKRINKRMDIMTQIINKRGFDFSIVDFDVFNLKNIFEKIIFTLFMGGFLSLKFADIKNQDPILTPLIDELKNALNK